MWAQKVFFEKLIMHLPGEWTFLGRMIPCPPGGLLVRKRTPGDLEPLPDSGLRASYSCAVSTGEDSQGKFKYSNKILFWRNHQTMIWNVFVTLSPNFSVVFQGIIMGLHVFQVYIHVTLLDSRMFSREQISNIPICCQGNWGTLWVTYWQERTEKPTSWPYQFACQKISKIYHVVWGISP